MGVISGAVLATRLKAAAPDTPNSAAASHCPTVSVRADRRALEGVRELALGVLELKRDEVALSLSGDDGVVDCGVAKARGCGGVCALAPNERASEFDDRNAPGRRGRVGSVLFGHGEEGLGSTAVMRFEEKIESRCDQVA